MSLVSQNHSNNVSWGVRIGIALPIVAFTAMLLVYAINVPWMDDVDVFPDFLGRFLEATDWQERWHLLFKPNNEHRVVYAKLANLLHYALTGTLNMRTLTIAANITLVGILWILWKVVREQNLPAIYFVPVPLILLQPQYYLTSLWTITGFQYQPVVFWGLMGMYFLSRQTTKTFVFAILLVFFDSFTMSNGMFYWLAGIVVLCLQGKYKHLFVWALCMLITMKVYFTDFSTEANDLGFKYFAQHPEESFFGFFTHLGGSFDFFTNWEIFQRSILPTIAGAGMMLIVSIWIIAFLLFSKKMPFKWLGLLSKDNAWSRLHQRIVAQPSNYILLGGLIFLLINALVIAILRPRFGYFVMIVGNYKIYPAMFMALTYLIIATTWLRYQSALGVKIAIALAVTFNVLSYGKFLPEVHERRKDLLTRAYNQRNNHIGLGPEIHSPFYEYVNHAMDNLVSKGIYTFPQGFYSSLEKELKQPITNKSLKKVSLVKTPNGIRIEETTLAQGGGLNDGNYILLQSPRKTYLVYEKNPHWWGKTYLGLSIVLDPKTYEPDTYKVGIVQVLGNQKQIFQTDKSVTIDY